MPVSNQVQNRFTKDSRIALINGDTLETCQAMPSGVFQLIISSPPYNLGKEYERRRAIEEYLDTQRPVIRELVRLLASGGSLCWQVGNYVDKGEVFPLDIFFYSVFKDEGLRLRNRIIWHFDHGLHASRRLSGRYETLLWFTKSDQYLFNLDAIRVPSKYPGKTYYKGPNKGQPSGNPLGKNPSDFWMFLEQEWDRLVWEIPNVKCNHPEKTVHPCQFPIELVERCVLALTSEDDYVLDPYCGVASALIAAIKNNRRAVGIDRESKYIELGRKRIHSLLAGTLRTRPMGKQVHKPSGNEKVTKVPRQWRTAENNQEDLL
ncbi:site-specific DNA-methyltransferase [bacterium]|nr:site-specific DNA-methyltransferase [bacterium]MBU1985108.1 site-specific DNA-methyltransferase [bacterium]